MQWQYLSKTIPTTPDEVLQIVLSNRGISDVKRFLSPNAPLDISFGDVGISPEDVDRAVSRIKVACEKKEKIIIFGDYDCDGVCATTVLWETLYRLGCSVMPFIPHREKHGYGLSKKALDEILKEGKPDILISVDNGIVAHTQWERLHAAGVFTILTDHHQPDETTPTVDCLIHTTQLCGTTVAWMLARELSKESSQSFLDLCAIATIADQVPLVGANRSFAKYGLEQLNKTQRLGLQLLIEVSGLTLGSIDAGSVNYGIAPRINAMGRLESALDALRALCARKEDKARELISRLTDVNQTRQDLTYDLIQKALQRADEWKDEHIIVIDDPDFHEGIIGLIASKLTETFFKPTICIARGELTSKASCRSIPGVHITNLLREIADDLVEVGGHPMAAGFKVETGKIEVVRAKLYQRAKELITSDQLIPRIEIDCELPSDLVTLETAEKLNVLEPYGATNRQPIFSLSNVVLKNVSSVGKDAKHLKVVFSLQSDDSNVIHGIGFGMGHLAEKLQSQPSASIAGFLSINEWKERKSVQIIVRTIGD